MYIPRHDARDRGLVCRRIEDVTVILHWYSGPLKHIDTALAAGMWFSVNPAMLRSRNGQRIVAALPPQRVVTETDGPYAKPGGRPSEPETSRS